MIHGGRPDVQANIEIIFAAYICEMRKDTKLDDCLEHIVDFNNEVMSFDKMSHHTSIELHFMTFLYL